MSKPYSVAIIGGGISGLAAALQLEKLANQNSVALSVSLFEAADTLGGKIQTVHRDGLTLELGAESFLSHKQPGIDFCRSLRIDSRLRGTRPENKKTFVWHKDQLHPLPEGLSGFLPARLSNLFRSDLLSLAGKLRVAADYLIPPRKDTSDESLASFLQRRLGIQAYERLVQPLLCGIYAGDGATLSLNATYPDLGKLERQHGGLLKGLKKRRQDAVKNSGSIENSSVLPPFVTLPNGMSELIECASSELTQTQIRLRHRVTTMIKIADRWSLNLESEESAAKESKEFDFIILTTPAHISASILEACNPNVARILSQIPHVSTITINMWFDENQISMPWRGYGFVIPSGQQNGLTAVTWTSSKHSDRAPNNLRLLRAYMGRAGAEANCELDDSMILNQVLPELKRTMNLTVKPSGYQVQRWPQGSPQYTMGHLDRLDEIAIHLSNSPNVFVTGSSYRGVGIPDCIRESTGVANRIFESIAKDS